MHGCGLYESFLESNLSSVGTCEKRLTVEPLGVVDDEVKSDACPLHYVRCTKVFLRNSCIVSAKIDNNRGAGQAPPNGLSDPTE